MERILEEEMKKSRFGSQGKSKGTSRLATIAQIANALKVHTGLSPRSRRARRQSKESLYLDIVAEDGRDAFVSANDQLEKNVFLSTPDGSPDKTSLLPSTPSMAMLTEATEALKESPSALTKMTDISSTGGVYQLRRKSKHVWEESSTDSSPASHHSSRSASARSNSLNLLPRTAQRNIHVLKRSASSTNAAGLARQSSLTGGDRHKVLPGLQENGVVLEPRRKHLMRSYSRSGSAPPRNRLRREVSRVAVFKPEDEETGAASAASRVGAPNPEREGMVVGGGAKRERAAYVLDKMYLGFSGVPPTALIKVPSEVAMDELQKKSKYKRGSLQRFCPSDGSAEENPHLVGEAPKHEVHKIGLLDLRIFNTDRHAGNILVQKAKSNVKLIPIDHALSLPDWRCLGEAYFDWHFWSQSAQPFDKATTDYIESLDVDKDGEALRNLSIPECCVATNRICTLALKAGARCGFTLRDFGQFFQRPYPPGHPSHPAHLSPLEHLLAQACELAGEPYRKVADREQLVVDAAGVISSALNDLSRTTSSRDISAEVSHAISEGIVDTDKPAMDPLSDDETDSEEEDYFDSEPPSANVLVYFSQLLDEKTTSGEWKKWLV